MRSIQKLLIFGFLLTTQVGGVGLNLTGADRVVIFDPSWNNMDDQVVDRAYRIGQTRNVIIYRLITCGTIEEKMYRKQVFKGALSRCMTQKDQSHHRYFTSTELSELFRLDDPKTSQTQQMLQKLHSHKRKRRESLDVHSQWLSSLDIFGISDHDLLYSESEKPTKHSQTQKNLVEMQVKSAIKELHESKTQEFISFDDPIQYVTYNHSLRSKSKKRKYPLSSQSTVNLDPDEDIEDDDLEIIRITKRQKVSHNEKIVYSVEDLSESLNSSKDEDDSDKDEIIEFDDVNFIEKEEDKDRIDEIQIDDIDIDSVFAIDNKIQKASKKIDDNEKRDNKREIIISKKEKKSNNYDSFQNLKMDQHNDKSNKTNNQRTSKKIFDLDLTNHLETENNGFDINVPKRSSSVLSLFKKIGDDECLDFNTNSSNNKGEKSTNIEEVPDKKRKRIIDLT